MPRAEQPTIRNTATTAKFCDSAQDKTGLNKLHRTTVQIEERSWVQGSPKTERGSLMIGTPEDVGHLVARLKLVPDGLELATPSALPRTTDRERVWAEPSPGFGPRAPYNAPGKLARIMHEAVPVGKGTG